MTKGRKQFVKGGDTHIINTLTGEEYYATCELGLLELLNNQQDEIQQLKENIENEKYDYRVLFTKYVYLQEKNIELREEIVKLRQKIKENGELQKKLDWLCEKYGYSGDGV